MVVPLKQFGKGQVTLPKKWRDQFDTDYFLAEETPQGLLIKPLVESVYYENEEEFGLNFPTGIPASVLLKKLKAANEKLS
jgi:bifunctional DNA-binding transcriptional regulator/antitoxin component of YhaV-PrlF toxin-antitoxin module